MRKPNHNLMLSAKLMRLIYSVAMRCSDYRSCVLVKILLQTLHASGIVPCGVTSGGVLRMSCTLQYRDSQLQSPSVKLVVDYTGSEVRERCSAMTGKRSEAAKAEGLGDADEVTSGGEYRRPVRPRHQRSATHRATESSPITFASGRSQTTRSTLRYLRVGLDLCRLKIYAIFLDVDSHHLPTRTWTVLHRQATAKSCVLIFSQTDLNQS
jgi:hypothetical protein